MLSYRPASSSTRSRRVVNAHLVDLLKGKLVKHAFRLPLNESRDEGPPPRLDKCNQFSFQGASHKSGDRRGARIEVTGITFG